MVHYRCSFCVTVKVIVEIIKNNLNSITKKSIMEVAHTTCDGWMDGSVDEMRVSK